MKNFVLILKNNKNSEAYGKNCIESAKKYKWNIEIFDAVNGYNHTLSEYDLVPSMISKKCESAFNRPGVVGCFLSHYSLWLKCLELDEYIGIFEHDIIFQKNIPEEIVFDEVLRLDRLQSGKNHGTGNWWKGSHAYFVSPKGAKKLIDWSKKHGAFPSDVMLGTDIVNIEFDQNNLISLDETSRLVSTTKNNF